MREIDEVDGASVEEWQLVERFPDPRLDALETVEQLMHASDAGDLAIRLANGVRSEFNADWSVVLRDVDVARAPSAASIPESSVLARARRPERRRRPRSRRARPDPTTSRSHRLDALGAMLLVGRDGHPFRRRERQQLLALARIADRIAALVD